MFLWDVICNEVMGCMCVYIYSTPNAIGCAARVYLSVYSVTPCVDITLTSLTHTAHIRVCGLMTHAHIFLCPIMCVQHSHTPHTYSCVRTDVIWIFAVVGGPHRKQKKHNVTFMCVDWCHIHVCGSLTTFMSHSHTWMWSHSRTWMWHQSAHMSMTSFYVCVWTTH